MPRHDGKPPGRPFEKGHAKLGGRTPGGRNRVSRDFVEVTRELFDRADIQAAVEQKVRRDLRTAGAASFTSKLITVVHGDSLIVTGHVGTEDVTDPEARDRRLAELLASAMQRRAAGKRVRPRSRRSSSRSYTGMQRRAAGK